LLVDPGEFAYVIESELGVREALVVIWKAAVAAGWTVVGDYDLTGLLSPEGDGIEIKSLDICRPELARPFVGEEVLTALCMPCNVLIYSEEGVTKLAAMRPGVMMPRLFSAASQALGDLPERVDRELREILKAAG
jgi:uncharacterized protein (DUF302 family)